MLLHEHYGITPTAEACSYYDTTLVYFLSALRLSDVRICSSSVGLGPFRIWRLAHRVGGWRGTFWRNRKMISDSSVSFSQMTKTSLGSSIPWLSLTSPSSQQLFVSKWTTFLQRLHQVWKYLNFQFSSSGSVISWRYKKNETIHTRKHTF